MGDRKHVLRKMAHALAWDMSIAKQSTPRRIFENQTDGCKERFLEQATDLLRCMRRAGLMVTVRTRTPAAGGKEQG